MHNVLVVDDDVDILEVVEIVLSNNDFKVTSLSRGEGVLEVASSHIPDVILLDINLGNMDGRDICKNLKDSEMTKNIPIVMFSANRNMKDNLCPCAADNFIEKPFETEHLVAILNALCN